MELFLLFIGWAIASVINTPQFGDSIVEFIKASASRLKHGPVALSRRDALNMVLDDPALFREVGSRYAVEKELDEAVGAPTDSQTGQLLAGEG